MSKIAFNNFELFFWSSLIPLNHEILCICFTIDGNYFLKAKVKA